MNRPITRRRTRRPRTSIDDVAAEAGVSVATVSRALRDLPNVADSTRARVRAAAERLDYRADPAASRLATGRSRSVAVMVPMLNGWYFSNVVAGAEAVCADAGYDTIVMGVGGDLREADVVHATRALARRTDAAIFVDIEVPESELADMTAQSLVVVSIGRELAGAPWIGIDDVEVGRLATQHLLDLGHRRIGLIEGPEHDPFKFVVPRRRQQGYEQALTAAGIPIDPSIVMHGDFRIQGGHDVFGRLVDVDDPPTAIFALGDEMAFGVMLAARERGLRIPEDLSLIGVDDHDFAAVVELTTIHQDVADHGARAARAVVALLAGQHVPVERENAAVHLVERRTTAPPPRRPPLGTVTA